MYCLVVLSCRWSLYCRMHCRTTFLLSTSLTSLEELGRYNVVYGCVLTLTQTLSTYTQWTYPMGGVCVPWELFDQCESSEEDLGFECLYQPTTVARGNPLLVSAPFAYNLSHTHTSTPLLLAIVTISSPPFLPSPIPSSSSPSWPGPSGCDEARAGCAVGVGGGQRRSRVHIAQTNWMCLLSGGWRDGG